MKHKDGGKVNVDFSSPWGRAMSREAFIWWLTQTSRLRLEAVEEVKAIFANPTHPDHAHASEVMALLIAERMMQ